MRIIENEENFTLLTNNIFTTVNLHQWLSEIILTDLANLFSFTELIYLHFRESLTTSSVGHDTTPNDVIRTSKWLDCNDS